MSKPVIEIDGFDELVEKLKKLGDDKSKRAPMLRVLRNVARTAVKVGKQNAPVSKRRAKSSLKSKKSTIPGTLQKSIGVITGRKGQAKENPTVYVGPRVKGKYNGWYGHFVEYGHNIYRSGFKRRRAVSIKAKTHNATGVRKTTKAIPFMQKTFDQTKGMVTSDAEKKVTAFIRKEINKLSN